MKRIQIIGIIYILGLLCSGCSSEKNLTINKEKENKYENVSLISVITNPEKFHKKHIQVTGYFILEQDGNSIYVSKEDYQNSIYKNGIFLITNREAMKEIDIHPPFKGYVTITGFFNSELKGSYNFYSGTIEKVVSIKRLYKKGTTTDEFNMN
jgi:hypothetical protein